MLFSSRNRESRVLCQRGKKELFPSRCVVFLRTEWSRERNREEEKGFVKDKKQAFKVLNVGEYRHEKKVKENEAAALMRVINTLYNMEEAITKS